MKNYHEIGEHLTFASLLESSVTLDRWISAGISGSKDV